MSLDSLLFFDDNENHTLYDMDAYKHCDNNNNYGFNNTYCNNYGVVRNSLSQDFFELNLQVPLDSWAYKSIYQWTNLDFMHWIMSYAKDQLINFEDIQMENFNNWNGITLYDMTLPDYLACDIKYGELIHNGVQALLEADYEINNYSPHSCTTTSQQDSYDILDYLCREMERKPSNADSICESLSSTHLSIPQTVSDIEDHSDNATSDGEGSVTIKSEPSSPMKRPVGRPKGQRIKKKERSSKLWEFIRNMLHNPEYCPSWIRWENHEEGVFKFVQTDKVAQLWGKRKSNSSMNYEKLSRAMRYYYKTRIFEPVPDKRLVYRFGPCAKGWRTSNPNFQY